MIIALLGLILTAGSPTTAATQARLDGLVHKCMAGHVIRLTAQSPTEVIIDMIHVERAPTPSERRLGDCVLRGISGMPDLQFGFLGNAAIGG
jgi:hypothetical protein